MRSIIVAYDRERAIGANNDLLWKKSEMKADIEYFRFNTMGAALIMGRKTLESIGIALPGRETIVVTRGDSIAIPGVQIAHSLEEAYRKADETGREDVFVCGGGEIYTQAVNDADQVFATEVQARIKGADTYFPQLGDSWRAMSRVSFKADQDNIYPYDFVIYKRDETVNG